MNFEEYTLFDGLGLARLLRNGDVSPTELRQTALELVKQADPLLNMMAEIFETEPVVAPVISPDAPFKGVPAGFKDIALYFEGLKYEFACELADGLRMKSTSETAARLASAGFTFLGRTTTPELGLGCDTVSAKCGQTRNPRDLMRSPGGSSGGSAALVASGCVPIAHGSDSLGSLRIPAHCCGVVALKPPRGFGSRAPGWGGFGDLSVNHVVSRTIRDSGAMLDVFAGADLGGVPAVAVPSGGYLAACDAGFRPLKIAVISLKDAAVTVDPDVASMIERVRTVLGDNGHLLDDCEVDLNLDALSSALAVVVASNQAKAIRNIARTMERDIGPDSLEPPARACLEFEKDIATVDLFDALDMFNFVSRKFNRLTETYDLLMMPTCTSVAPKLGVMHMDLHFTNASAKDGLISAMRAAFDFIHLCPIFNISGQPAMSFPLVGQATSMPVGIQFAASLTNTPLLLQIGRQLEDMFDPIRPTRCGSDVTSAGGVV